MPLRSLLLTLVLIAAHVGGANPVRVGIADAPLDWNPGRTRASVGSSLLDSVYERLVDLNSDGDPIPALATGWVWVEPNRWRFTLRPGVRFHNGEAFDAATAKRNLEAQRDDFRSASRTWLIGIERIDVTADLTLEIITTSPDAELPLALAWAGRMAPSEAGFDGAGYREAQLLQPVGTGPYRLVAWGRGRPALLEANPDWWGGQVAVASIEVLPIDDPEARLAGLLAGELGLISDPPAGARAAHAIGALELLALPDQRLIYLLMDSYRELGGPAPAGSPGVNPGEPNPLRDPLVRRALSLALDREALVTEVWHGLAVPSALPILSGSWGAIDAPTPPRPDRAAARALLAEAGYPDGFDLRLVAMVGVIPKAEAVMAWVVEGLRAVGVRATLEVPAYEVAARRYTSLDVSMGIASWGGLSTPRRAWMGMFGSDPATDYFGGQNIGRFIDREINALLGAINLEMETEARQALHAAVMARHLEVTPTLPLYLSVHLLALTPGYTIEARGMDRLPLRDLRPATASP
jgi:peptide/nickel transport system substrate-binding protein